MSYYSFKVNPKQKVVDKAKNLFGRDAKVKVTGKRLSPLECKGLSIPSGSYLVECTVNGKFIADANLRDWRKAYGLLVIAVEKSYEETVLNASSILLPPTV